MHRLILLLFIFSMSKVNAQTGVLRGKVVDINTLEPIAWALIYTSDSLNIAESGLQGHYRLSGFTSEKVNIRVCAFPDYKDTLIEGIDVSQLKRKLFLIRLTPGDIKTMPAYGSKKCPICNSESDAVPIVYGEQTFEMIYQQQKRQLVFAGCCHYPSYPLMYCKKCRVKY
jgi:hypothetical protein